MDSPQYKLAILGCGAIFNRHLAAINANSEHFKLCGVYDPNLDLAGKYAKELNIRAYANESDVYLDKNINCIAILSPSHLHYTQAVLALNSGLDVILEKPATFSITQLDALENLAKKNNKKIFCVLQVRLNPSIVLISQFLQTKLMGRARSVSLVQRWQRPLEYFSGWRGQMQTGGGVLREFAIHYLDVMQYLMGCPEVLAASFFSNKFLNTDVSDTIYALFDFGGFGGNMEINLSSEPKNLECSLSLIFENGFIKLGGKSLDQIIEFEVIDTQIKDKFIQLQEQSINQQHQQLALGGASPYHPELYRKFISNPAQFSLTQTRAVIGLIENIYAKQSV